MGLCYDCGFKALTVALALRLPGDCLPLGGPGGTDQHGELAVVEQAERAEQLTADRDRFSLSTLASALPLEQDTIGQYHRHRPKPFCPLCPPVDGVDKVDSGGHGGQIGGDLSVKLLL